MNSKLIQISSSLLLMCLCDAYSNEKNNNNVTRVIKSNRLLSEQENNEKLYVPQNPPFIRAYLTVPKKPMDVEPPSAYEDPQDYEYPVGDDEVFGEALQVYAIQLDNKGEKIAVPKNSPFIRAYLTAPRNPVNAEPLIPEGQAIITETPFRAPSPPPVTSKHRIRRRKPKPSFQNIPKISKIEKQLYPHANEIKKDAIHWDNFCLVMNAMDSDDSDLEDYLLSYSPKNERIFPKYEY
ncbi:erythrocyte membrane associated protein 2, putative [Plasmodium vinckei brucechwatti]|uniref:Erythrocyte membrane associated protein 2, putative n=1 Tax=Plasmodium vinckei brucechwatti TaxID=119398 RepID=A0A6V7SFE6_PLAVN|nr:erythrocyte membrane associated protein 2, putative [Plasmodium vinckei brucechwatti]